MSVRAGGAEDMFLNVKEHVFSASGAYAHALPLLSRLPAKSRKRPSLLPVLAPYSSATRSSTTYSGKHISAGRRVKAAETMGGHHRPHVPFSSLSRGVGCKRGHPATIQMCSQEDSDALSERL